MDDTVAHSSTKTLAEDPDEKCGYIYERLACDDHSKLKHLSVGLCLEKVSGELTASLAVFCHTVEK